MDQRLENLESKLAHLELTVDELNQVVYKQSRQLERAIRLIEDLRARVKEVTEQGADQPHVAEDERPPHY